MIHSETPKTPRRRARPLRRLSRGVLAAAAALALAWLIASWLLPFPEERLDRWGASPCVLDVRGRPMLSLVASDDQWRLPVPLHEISPWLAKATVAAEDRRFYSHPGIDPVAIVRAAASNLLARRIVSGASTLDMQVCRMMDDRPRTLWSKLVESFRAVQLEHLKSKDEILAFYLNTAPYGSNLRGVEAASLAYFGKHARDLSLAEAALVAGLPQSPSRLRADRNLAGALVRQKVVLARMAGAGLITADEQRHAEADPILLSPASRTPPAPHAAWLALQQRPRGSRTTIDLDIQAEVQRLADEHRPRLPGGSEQAVVVIDIADSAIVALVGSADARDPVEGQVNGVTALRSPGSALKPFIYAAAFEAGRLNAESTVYDVPIQRAGWKPSNFDHTFTGEVPAAEALRRSLNVPAILVAEGVGLARCCGVLEAAGVRLPPGTEARGGLALAVGGIDVTLLDLTNAYATLGRGGIRCTPRLFVDERPDAARALDAAACQTVSEILSVRHRRPGGLEDSSPADGPWFMWKTGTSAGRRDAWAVGHNTRYAIGVWVGRFRGTGRIDFVGASAAQPLVADLFRLPRLRAAAPPPPPAPLVVRRPLPPPAEAGGDLRILAPSDGEMFVALGGKAVIRPLANQPGDLQWFLGGRLLDARDAARLELPPGRYELRCVDPSGRSSYAVRVTICPAVAARSEGTLVR